MALYDGFFDAVYNDETGAYDRTYNAADFTGYFGEFIGSGVCVRDNDSSMLVSATTGGVVIAPGYLFIAGYWLKNDADYTVELSGAGIYAILAHLDTGTRIIEITTQTKATPEEYPDALVLAYATLDSDGGITVEDTRRNSDICGVIDAAGDLSVKIAYAINYIDNEVAAKLDEVEATVNDQSAKLDVKLEEVNAQVEKLGAPPIGELVFTASDTVDEGWLLCDGRYISAADYPELVAMLGRSAVGAEDFAEVAGGSVSGAISNGYIADGYLWVYSLSNQKLYGYSLSNGAAKSIAVTGATGLTASTANPVVLSICGGYAFLAQSGASTYADFYLYKSSASFSSSASALAFTRVSLGEDTTTLGESFSPEITYIEAEARFFMALGVKIVVTDASPDYGYAYLHYITWSSDFATRTAGTEVISYTLSSGTYTFTLAAMRAGTYKQSGTVFKFSRKNGGDAAIAYTGGSYAGGTGTTRISSRLTSFPLGLYTATEVVSVSDVTDLDTDPYITAPVAANNYFVYRAYIKDSALHIRAGTYNPSAPYDMTDNQAVNVDIPSGAALFVDSIEYSATHDLWFIFLGTGLAFSRTPLDMDSWGYFDTTGVLGVITQSGCIEFDEDNSTLCISGRDTTGALKVGMMRFGDTYNFSSDGAYLPLITAGGVPAYIKAIDS